MFPLGGSTVWRQVSFFSSGKALHVQGHAETKPGVGGGGGVWGRPRRTRTNDEVLSRSIGDASLILTLVGNPLKACPGQTHFQ
jgi:hypothetical protein